MSRGAFESIRDAVIASAGGALVTSLMRSTHMRLIEGADTQRRIVDERVPAIYVLWHGRLLPCAFHYRHRGFGTLITRNRDGDYITRMIERWGFRVLRGSSSRGGATALRSIVRMLRQGGSVALTPDGPRGPRQKMKLGPLHAAQAAGVPIVPVSAGAASGWYFGRWDRFLVPRPFTRIHLALGSPREVPRNASADELLSIAGLLEDDLNRLTELVDASAGASR